MFALEITFQDGETNPETVFVQRPYAIIGASDFAHVVVGDLAELPYELHVYRGVGRNFRTVPISRNKSAQVDLPKSLEGQFDETATFDLGPVTIMVEALDTDLSVGSNEPLDKSAVRILRRAATHPMPRFPAIAVGGEQPMAVSFAPDLPIMVGRDRECTLRLDSPDVSTQHARITHDNDEFWIEDLGSTNGTYIAGQQVSGKSPIGAGQPIVIGRGAVIYALEKEVVTEMRQSAAEREISEAPVERYPMLVSLSEVARPPRLILQQGSSIRVGREPSSDLWLGAPHVSRRHCTIEYIENGNIVLTDLSMNGLAYDGGVLSQGESVQLGDRAAVLNFGGGITVAVCLSPNDEEQFTEMAGHPTTFIDGDSGHYHSARSFHRHRGSVGARRHSMIRFFRQLTLAHRIALMFTIFLVALATSLILRLIFPLLWQNG